MGLDGISVNQLRITPENNSAEANNRVRFNLNAETKVVDGLSVGQKIDPDEENEQVKQELKKNFNENEDEQQDEESLVEETIKYDLSKTDKYMLKLNEDNDEILIIDKSNDKIIQRLDANELSRFVNFLSNSQGSMINRKF